MAGSPVPMSIHLLPVDPLLHVFSFVDFRSLARCAQVCRRFRHLAEHETLWKSHCRMCWLLEQLPARQTWRGLFQDTYRDLGRYVTVYAPLKRTWLDLEEFLKNHCPSLMATLKGGATEQMLHAVEEKIGRILPEDLRCSLRIHNGQMLKGTGLMGSVAISYHHRSECLLDVETAMQGYSQQRRLIDSLPLTFCTRTGLTQYIALSDVGGRARGNVFYHSPNQTDSEICDAFLTGRHFSEWFMEYVRNVVGRKYPLIGEEIFRYMETGNVARTGSISVSVSTAFLPEFSFIHPPHYSFSYRIRMAMEPTASPDDACQLSRRCWYVIDERDYKQKVEGQGVVGEYPILRPGSVYEYTSCTTFFTTTGHMEGFYTFHHLDKDSTPFHVTIPRFDMSCPPCHASQHQKEENESQEDCEWVEEEDGDGDVAERK